MEKYKYKFGSMCPLCISAIVVGATSIGGLTIFSVKKSRRKSKFNKNEKKAEIENEA